MMDKSNQTSGESTSSSSNKEQQYLKQLNKLSHKISKPTIKRPSFNENNHAIETQQQNNPQQQPPVYNINKNDFRELVQKLTGSPAHSNSNPATASQKQPPLQPTKPQTSRLHRIRPPPLAQISNRPYTAPLSPLPPFPGVVAAAESPVTAYLRNFLGSTPTVNASEAQEFSGFAPLASPKWSSLVPVHPPQGIAAASFSSASSVGMIGSQGEFQFPASPLPFGCLNSPSGQFGFPQLPLSPTVPLPSPK